MEVSEALASEKNDGKSRSAEARRRHVGENPPLHARGNDCVVEVPLQALRTEVHEPLLLNMCRWHQFHKESEGRSSVREDELATMSINHSRRDIRRNCQVNALLRPSDSHSRV